LAVVVTVLWYCLFFGGVERAGGCGGGVADILLGPEKTSHTVGVPGFCGVVGVGFGFSVAGLRCHQTSSKIESVFGCWWCVGCGVGVLFENCIVDASIFVVKLLRANGGCLGTRSR
jgi:hypothetical protein